LHTNSAAAAIPRLLDMGIEPYLLASTMRVVVAQRLPRTICKHCIESYLAEPEIVEDILSQFKDIPNFDVIGYINQVVLTKKQKAENGASVMKEATISPDGKPQIYLYHGKGCDRCGGSGYSGRIGIFEVLDVTEKISRMVMDHSTAGDIDKEARKNGMLSMMQDGYLKSLEGITTIEEVMRVSRE
jgi:general secretion pathway protein E